MCMYTAHCDIVALIKYLIRNGQNFGCDFKINAIAAQEVFVAVLPYRLSHALTAIQYRTKSASTCIKLQ